MNVVATAEVVLAVLRDRPRHGYEIKHEHDAWFPDAKPLAFGQVYATLSRLQRDGLVKVAETQQDGAPERTVYALTAEGRRHLQDWLAEPTPVAGTGTEEFVRKAVAALRTGVDTAQFLARQRASHLRRMRELQEHTGSPDLASRLVREHLLARLDADLRWLDTAAEITRGDRDR